MELINLHHRLICGRIIDLFSINYKIIFDKLIILTFVYKMLINFNQLSD